MSSLMPNAHISEVVLTPPLDMEASSDDPRTDLDSHTNMVFLGSNYSVFESTRSTRNVQPLNSDFGMAKHDPIVDGALGRDFPHKDKFYVLAIRNALHVPSMDHKMS